MRQTVKNLYVPSLLALSLACGSSKLEKADAETQLRAHYPVTVMLRVPEQAGAASGSAEGLRLKGLAEALAASGWFEASAPDLKGRVTFTAKLKPGAPTTIQPLPQAFRVPVAKAVFDRALRNDVRDAETRVTYQIRLEEPNALFPAFQLRYPNAKVGGTTQRHARFTKEGRAWKLAETDEKYGKAEE
ncbi:MAG TPA: hypothetical protein VJ570_03225 [Holophagaceae bacterium]|nr:hypothetical protein [Holophagaceae bacterium]